MNVLSSYAGIRCDIHHRTIAGNVSSYKAHFLSVIEQTRFFNAFLDRNNDVKPLAVPLQVKSAENIVGAGEPGTIKKITYADESLLKYALQRVDEIDEENFKYGYTVIDGSPLGNNLEKIYTEFKIVAVPKTPDGIRSLLTFTSNYYIKDNNCLSDEEVEAGKTKALRLCKDVEVYLHNNPDACN